MDSKIKNQRICIKFCVRNEIKANETYNMIKKAFADDSMTKRNILLMHKKYITSDGLTDDDEIPAEMASKDYVNKILKVKNLLKGKDELTVLKIAEKVNLSMDECAEILVHLLKKDSCF